MPFMESENGNVKITGKELKLETEYNLIKNILGYDMRKINCNERKIDDIFLDINETPTELSMDYIKRYGEKTKTKKPYNK